MLFKKFYIQIFLESDCALLDFCISPLDGHYELMGIPIRVKFTPLNRVPFGKFNGAGGQGKWANPELFEAIRPSFQDLVSKPMDGSESSSE